MNKKIILVLILLTLSFSLSSSNVQGGYLDNFFNSIFHNDQVIGSGIDGNELFSYNNVEFNENGTVFEFRIKDPQGVADISVRGYGEDWDPFYDIYRNRIPELISGDVYDGNYKLVAKKIYRSDLGRLDASKGWYVVWKDSNGLYTCN